MSVVQHFLENPMLRELNSNKNRIIFDKLVYNQWAIAPLWEP